MLRSVDHFPFALSRTIRDFQKKNNELLERNRELLTHIQELLIYSHQLEQKETFKVRVLDSLLVVGTRLTLF